MKIFIYEIFLTVILVYISIYISDREVDDKLFVNLIQYKAYLTHSGYDEEAIDKQFIKVAKMKRNS